MLQRLLSRGAAKPAGLDADGMVTALKRTNAVIEFSPTAKVLEANGIFLSAFGYTLAEVSGQHHRMFVDPEEAALPEYAEFWAALGRGESRSGEFSRRHKDGRVVWIRATYHPIRDAQGAVQRVVKIADDITRTKLRAAVNEAQLSAIDRSQAVIEFQLDGIIVTANSNFLNVMGYRLDEIEGRHHRMFVDPAESAQPAYAEFWAGLQRGQHQAAVYRRLRKDGREVWIQATYNPVLGFDGKPVRVVKFATDITKQIQLRQACTRQCEDIALNTRQLDQAIAEIAHSMERSRTTADIAQTQLSEAGGRVTSLTQASVALGAVVESIKAVSSQINLLALNAAIEAASAGQAGRGFAVVAGEVKTLARQSHEAASTIEREISRVCQLATGIAADLTQATNGLTALGHEIQTASAAVQEQSASTDTINDGMQEMDRSMRLLV